MTIPTAALIGVVLISLLLGWTAAVVHGGRTAAARLAGQPRPGTEGPDELARTRSALRAAEARAREAEERAQLALRGSLDGWWEWQVRHGRVQLSPRWRGMLGVDADALGGSGGCRLDAWLGLVHTDDRARLTAALDQLADGRSTRVEEELRLLHRDGTVRHVLTRALAMPGDDGRTERVIGIDTDVTRIRRVHAVLDAVADGTAGAHGPRFFAAMTEHLARALQVDCAFITECADQPVTRLRTLAWWSVDQGLRENFEYELTGTPCDEVVHGRQLCFHPQQLADRFPREQGWEAYVGLPIVASDGRVLGHLALLHKSRLTEDVLVERVYRIFLARAAAEIERMQALARLAGLTGRGGAQPA